MRSSIFSYLLVAGLVVLLCSAVFEPQPQKVQGKIYSLNKSLGGGGFIPPAAVIIPKTNALVDYLPYIGALSAGIGIAEKLAKLIGWFRRKS